MFYVMFTEYCEAKLTLYKKQIVAPPPPHLDFCFYGEEQVSEEALVHVRPAELWDAKHGGTRARGAALSPRT